MYWITIHYVYKKLKFLNHRVVYFTVGYDYDIHFYSAFHYVAGIMDGLTGQQNGSGGLMQNRLV